MIFEEQYQDKHTRFSNLRNHTIDPLVISEHYSNNFSVFTPDSGGEINLTLYCMIMQCQSFKFHNGELVF